MDAKILEEVLFTIEDLRSKIRDKKEGRLQKVDEYFDLPDLNIIWGLVAGIR